MASSDSDTYISSVKAVIPSDPRGIRRPPLTFDAPAHTPYRTAIERTLKPARLKRLGEVLEKHAATELAKLTAKGEGNICTEFASIYSAWVECEVSILGVGFVSLLTKSGTLVAQFKYGSSTRSCTQCSALGLVLENSGLAKCEEILGWILRYRQELAQ